MGRDGAYWRRAGPAERARAVAAPVPPDRTSRCSFFIVGVVIAAILWLAIGCILAEFDGLAVPFYPRKESMDHGVFRSGDSASLGAGDRHIDYGDPGYAGTPPAHQTGLVTADPFWTEDEEWDALIEQTCWTIESASAALGPQPVFANPGAS